MERPFLTYRDLEIGRTFKPFVLEITPEFAKDFREAVGDDNPLYSENSIVPVAIAGIYGRRSYLEEYRMPPGGILVRQEFEFLKPLNIGDTITASAKVIDRYEKRERKYVSIETTAMNQKDEVVGIVRLTAIWPR